MQLYVFPPSPNSLCCQAAANQAGIELELISVNLGAGDQMKPDFLKLNPNHKIPTLLDGDFVLWESGAILVFLGEKAAVGNLLPADMKQKLEALQWVFWRTSHFGPACGVYTFERLVKPMLGLGETDEAVVAQGAEDFHRYLAVLEEAVSGKDFLLGDHATIADHAIVSWLYCAEPAGYPMENYKEVQRWAAGLLSSDAWQQAMATIPQPS